MLKENHIILVKLRFAFYKEISLSKFRDDKQCRGAKALIRATFYINLNLPFKQETFDMK